MSEELQVLQEVASKLNEAKIPYMVSGSVAMNYYAQPRMTRDIDVVVMLNSNEVDGFVALFEKDFYIDPVTVREEIARGGMFNLIHNKYVIKIDFILRKSGAYDDGAFQRKKRVKVDGFHVWIISPEDLMLNKLRWAQESMSEMQLNDVRNIIEASADLDWQYLTKWADSLGARVLLDQVRR